MALLRASTRQWSDSQSSAGALTPNQPARSPGVAHCGTSQPASGAGKGRWTSGRRTTRIATGRSLPYHASTKAGASARSAASVSMSMSAQRAPCERGIRDFVSPRWRAAEHGRHPGQDAGAFRFAGQHRFAIVRVVSNREPDMGIDRRDDEPT